MASLFLMMVIVAWSKSDSLNLMVVTGNAHEEKSSSRETWSDDTCGTFIYFGNIYTNFLLYF